MKPWNPNHLALGVCYYPEHWAPSLWRDDLRRMKALGLEVVRIAEFAWNKFEPHEGEFTFEFFDSFMDLALEEKMKVIFCTPSATPPAWMSHRYPEILNADLDGNLIHHGLRRHYSINSERYRFFVSRITERLAEHYSRYPNIVAWQLDNEINCECHLYYSENDHRAFRTYLQARFGTVEKLNEAIGATFWNQTYTAWEEVFLPRRTNSLGHSNPHMMLLEKRFISDSVIDFFKLQTDILRRYTNVPITTNGLFRYVDYHRLTDEVLDFISFDNYPNFAFRCDTPVNDTLLDRRASHKLMRTRSISPIFGIMEEQSGAGGWTHKMQQISPKPGQLRLWTMQAIAHGADFVNYFRWRTCTYGTEIYWHGILNYDNRDNRRSAEVAKTHADVQKLQLVCGKEYLAEVALLKDYDNEWDGAEDVWHSQADDVSYDGWFRAAQKSHVPLDLVYVNDDTELDVLRKYKMVVYPHPTILTKARAKLLRAYAEQGGVVIFGCRTGYKDRNGICRMIPMPGYAAELCGAEVEDFTARPTDEPTPTVRMGDESVHAPFFHDILTPTDGHPIATFESDYYAGKCAAVCKTLGTGRAYYFGAAFDEHTAHAFLRREKIGAPMGLNAILSVPECVELAVRGEHIFLLNYTAEPVKIGCVQPMYELLTERTVDGEISLEAYAYGVAVLARRNP